MANEKKNKPLANIAAILATAFVGTMIRTSTVIIDFAQGFGVGSDFAISLFSIVAAIVAGMLTYIIFARLIKIDEI